MCEIVAVETFFSLTTKVERLGDIIINLGLFGIHT